MDDKQEKLKAYETSLRHRVQCEEKAFYIVNRLIDGAVADQFLIECGEKISRDHYESIVEERAISYLCGYPICSNSLKNVPRKQFHICTRTNKVYDISDRKNFCSNKCFQASKYFHNQIPDSPVWVRERVQQAKIELLPLDQARGLVGEQVIGESPRKALEAEVKALEELPEKPSNPRQKQGKPLKSKAPSKKDALDVRTLNSQGVNKPTIDVDNTKEKENTDEKKSSPGALCDSDTSRQVNHALEDAISAVGNLSVNDDTKTSALGSPQASSLHTQDESKINSASFEDSNVSLHDGQVKNQEENVVDTAVTNLEKLSLIDKVPAQTSLQVIEGRIGTNNTQTSKHQSSVPHSVTDSDKSPQSKKSENPQNSKSVTQSKESKMDQLMKLMAKRKGNLAAMVDLQEHSSAQLQEKVSESENIPRKTEEAHPNISESHSEHKASKTGPDTSKKDAASKKRRSKQIKTNTSARTESSALSPLHQIAKILITWLTESTTKYLSSSAATSSDTTSSTFSDPQIQKGYVELCQRLTIKEKEMDSTLDENAGEVLTEAASSTRPGKGVPVYDLLKQEAEEFQLKISEFMSGRPNSAAKKKENDADEIPLFFPTVDKYDQAQIRARIVIDRLDKSMPELLLPLQLSVQDVSTGIRELVHTFSLDKDNIIFRPSEWTLVSVFILKMLGQRCGKIASAFETASASRFFSILLKGIGHTTMDVELLLREMLSSVAPVDSVSQLD